MRGCLILGAASFARKPLQVLMFVVKIIVGASMKGGEMEKMFTRLVAGYLVLAICVMAKMGSSLWLTLAQINKGQRQT